MKTKSQNKIFRMIQKRESKVRSNFASIGSGERGVAALEFAISASVLVLFLLGTYDIGNSLLAYTYLTSNVREAARAGSRIAQLESKGNANPYVNLFAIATDADRDSCSAGTTTAFPCGQLLIQQRLRYLTQLHSLDNSLSNISIESQYFQTGAGTRTDAIRVRASGTYNGFLMRNMPISTEIISPYLYNEAS